MKPVERDALHTLLSAVVDGTIGEEQAAELTRMLKADADARRFYVRYLDMHAALADAASRPESAVRWRVPWIAIVASLMAASVLVALLTASVGSRSDESGPRGSEGVAVSVASAYVATISAASSDAVLNQGAVVPGTRLTPGPYEVAAGTVTVQFDGGARILFDGRASFTLRSRRALAIERGTFVFEGDRLCEPVEVATPRSVLRNIGTRYAAVVGDAAEELHVAEGAVRRTVDDGQRPVRHELVEAGAGRRYGGENVNAEAIPLDETLVSKLLEAAPAKPVDARPMVGDDFRGEGDRIKGMQTGFGWAEPWRSRLGDLRVVAPGLAGQGSVVVRHDGAGEESSRRRSAAHRTLEKPIDLSQDGVWYLRFLMRRGPCPGGDDHRAMVVLRTRGLTPQEEVEQAALIQIALRRDDLVMVRLADTLTRASLPLVPGQAYAVIAKIVAGRDKPEQVLLQLMAADRLAGSEEPTEWSVVSDSVPTDLQLDQVSLECVSRGHIEFGELCIGPTWESVAGVVGDR
ncbi:MAG: anti-sigma factor family protein [Planctomycetota bacterium]